MRRRRHARDLVRELHPEVEDLEQVAHGLVDFAGEVLAVVRSLYCNDVTHQCILGLFQQGLKVVVQ